MKNLIVVTKDWKQYLREENPFSQHLYMGYGQESEEWRNFEQSVQLISITFAAEDGQQFSSDEVYLDRFCENEEWVTAYRLKDITTSTETTLPGGETEIVINGDNVSFDIFENNVKFIVIGNEDEPRIWYCSDSDLIRLRDFLNQLPL